MRKRDVQAPALFELPAPPIRSATLRAWGGSVVTVAAAGTVGLLVLGAQYVGGFNWEPLALVGVGLVGVAGASVMPKMGKRQRRAFRAQLSGALGAFIPDPTARAALTAIVAGSAPHLIPTYSSDDHVAGNWRIRIETNGDVQLAARTVDDDGKTDWTTVAVGGAR